LLVKLFFSYLYSLYINYFLQQGLEQLAPHCFTESIVLLLQDVVWDLQDVLQDFMQQIALHTPHVNTTTKTAFKQSSIHSFQQLQFSHFINQFPLFILF